ncbi:MAG: preprotein translocase subunit SecG, partial [Phycisphaerales bacterium]
MGVLFTLLVILFLIASVCLVLIILVQRPQGGGLAQAFGGGSGGTDTAFGGRTGDALTYATVTAFGIYLALAIALNIMDSSLTAPPAPPEEVPVAPAPAPAAVIPQPVERPPPTEVPASALAPVRRARVPPAP